MNSMSLGVPTPAPEQAAALSRPHKEGQAPPLHRSLVLTELGFLAEQRGQAAEAR